MLDQAELEAHEIALLFPALQGRDFDELVEDIKRQGILRPIVLYEGKILDGRNRYAAALAAGVDCPREEYSGDDPYGYVASLNLVRRHLTQSQRGLLGGRLRALASARLSHRARDENRENVSGDKEIEGDRQICRSDALTQQQAADMVGVSERNIREADAVLSRGVPALGKAVESGEIALDAAAVIAGEPPERQQQLVQEIHERVKTAREVVKGVNKNRSDKRRQKQAREHTKAAAEGRSFPSARFPLIYADPPWQYDVAPLGGGNRAVENQYPTMPLAEICALGPKVKRVSSPNALLLLWTTVAKLLPDTPHVLRAWGFSYVSHAVWDKKHIGMGYWSYSTCVPLEEFCRRIPGCEFYGGDSTGDRPEDWLLL